jgi:hypothetical protein
VAAIVNNKEGMKGGRNNFILDGIKIPHTIINVPSDGVYLGVYIYIYIHIAFLLFVRIIIIIFFNFCLVFLQFFFLHHIFYFPP